ncbi:MAG TPA: hypothetical protein VF490_12125, partial [Chryseosolibacter sp.]
MSLVIPELILSGAILLILIIGLFGSKSNGLFLTITLAAACGSFILMLPTTPRPDAVLLNGLLHREGLGSFM